MQRLALLLVSLSLVACGVSTGDAEGDYKVGMMYLNGIGVTENAQEAFSWLLKAANAGNARAQFRLGVLYENGLGVDKNAVTSVEWFAKAAAQGITEAIYNVANAHRSGVGADRNYEKALALYKEAALKGFGPAAHNVGAMSGNGEGTPQSDSEAYRWLLLASKLGVESDVAYREKFRPSLSRVAQRQIEESVEIMLKQIRATTVTGSGAGDL